MRQEKPWFGISLPEGFELGECFTELEGYGSSWNFRIDRDEGNESIFRETLENFCAEGVVESRKILERECTTCCLAMSSVACEEVRVLSEEFGDVDSRDAPE